MTLEELGAEYRQTAAALRERIRLVQMLPAPTQGERIAKKERLRLLAAMWRDARAMAVICERYYDKTYCRNERYRL